MPPDLVPEHGSRRPGARTALSDPCLGFDPGTITVVLPALDEAAALPAALAGFPAGVDLVVVDNGSTDGTAAVAAAHGARVVREPRRGFGSACWAGVVGSPHAEVLAFVDADGTFDGADLAAVAGPVARGEADLVVGSRLRGRREPGSLPPAALGANLLLAATCRVLFGVRVTDLGPFRAIRRDALVALGMTDRGSGWPLEMLGRAAGAGLRVREVPVAYRRRAGGESKVSGSPGAYARAAARLMATAWRLRGVRRQAAALRAPTSVTTGATAPDAAGTTGTTRTWGAGVAGADGGTQ